MSKKSTKKSRTPTPTPAAQSKVRSETKKYTQAIRKQTDELQHLFLERKKLEIEIEKINKEILSIQEIYTKERIKQMRQFINTLKQK